MNRYEIKKPNSMDVIIATRVRQRRMALGVSQGTLAQLIGVTFQQVQKYEKGMNRIGASRLHRIAEGLGVSVGYFFESRDESLEPDIAEFGSPPREAAVLSRAFLAINDADLRRRLVDLVQSIAAGSDSNASAPSPLERSRRRRRLA